MGLEDEGTGVEVVVELDQVVVLVSLAVAEVSEDVTE